MKKKMPTPIKDGITGLAIGTAIIVPGISGGTIALVFGAFKKIVDAVDNLFTKLFWKSVGILIPFLIGAVLAVAALIFPFQLAFEYCQLAIVCLFAGFIIGSIPGITDEVKGQEMKTKEFVLLIVGFLVAGLIGVLSTVFNLNDTILGLFGDRPWYLYLIIFVVGVFGATGLIVPGFSGSMLLMVIGFYEPILNLVKTDNFWSNISLLAVFAVGVLVGFVIFSKIMNKLITNHRRATLFVVIGFIFGSIISIFVNSSMFAHYTDLVNIAKSSETKTILIIECVLSPILLGIGILLSTLFVRYTRKHPEFKDAKN